MLPSDRNHGHTLAVLAVLQLPEPAAQPQLRRPGASQGVGTDLLLALAEGAGDHGAVMIGPGRLHQLEPEMFAAGAGDVATPDAVARGAFAGHQPVKAMNAPAWVNRRQSLTSAASDSAPSWPTPR
jgi:hypothetical protein